MFTPALLLFLATGGAVAPLATPTTAATLTLGRSPPTPLVPPLSSATLFVDRSLHEGSQLDSARLGVQGRIGLGRFSSALQSSFALWSVSVGVDGSHRGLALAPSHPQLTHDGLLLARVGYGLYLGRPKAPPRGELFVFYESEKQRLIFGDSDPRNVPPYARQSFGIVGSLYLTPGLGLQLTAKAGRSWFVSLAAVGRF